jgi:hypothetical protein
VLVIARSAFGVPVGIKIIIIDLSSPTTVPISTYDESFKSKSGIVLTIESFSIFVEQQDIRIDNNK